MVLIKIPSGFVSSSKDLIATLNISVPFSLEIYYELKPFQFEFIKEEVSGLSLFIFVLIYIFNKSVV